MARMRRPGGNPREELKNLNKNTISSGDVRRRSEGSKIGSEVSNARQPRMKNLAQAAKSEVPKVKADLLQKLPVLTAVEVRRHRIPYHDSLILELEEEGLREAAEYMTLLFEFDEEMRIKAGPGTAIWRKPRLKNTKSLLERLRRGLTTAEIAKTSGESIVQAASLLDTAIFFESQTWEWFWIADQLYRSSLKVAKNFKDDDGQTLNVIRYLYGRFLFEKMNDPQEAVNYLNEVRVASEGKVWNASRIIGVRQENLYRESCTLLYKALLNLTRQIRNENPEVAVQTATFALQRATDSVHEEYIAAALYELGKSQLSSGNVKSALRTLAKYLAMTKRIPDPEGVCNAHMELAFAYKELGDSEGTVKHLSLLRECAVKYELPYNVAQAHYYTGEYLLSKNRASAATPHLELALRQFNSLGKIVETNRARCAAGVSKGQEVMDRYVNLILDCGARDVQATLKICRWKNTRTPFWISEADAESAEGETIADSDAGREKVDISDASANYPLSVSSLSIARSDSSIETDLIVGRTDEPRGENTEGA